MPPYSASMAEAPGLVLSGILLWGGLAAAWWFGWLRQQPEEVRERARRERAKGRGKALGAVLAGLVAVAAGAALRTASGTLDPRPFWAWVICNAVATLVWLGGFAILLRWGRRRYETAWPVTSEFMMRADAVEALPPDARGPFKVWSVVVVVAGCLTAVGLAAAGLGT
jgi:hypothetical protein